MPDPATSTKAKANVTDGSVPAPRSTSGDVSPAVLDGAPLQLAAVRGADDDEERPAAKGEAPPQLLLLSSGELSPFRLQLSERGKGGAAYELHSDGFSLPRAAPVASR